MSFTQRPGSGCPQQTSRLEDRHIIVFSDESRFHHSSDDNHARVWRPRGERLNPAFALQRNTAPTASVIVWGAITYNTRSPLILIRGTKKVQQKFLDKKVEPKNKAVLITGCDTGFGHLVAKRLDSKGFHVFATCLFPSGEGATELKKSCSQRLQVLHLDVMKDESVKEAAEFVKQNLGSCDLWAVVNNAGIQTGFSVELSDINDFKNCLEVNTLGPVRVVKAFLPLLRQSKGRIVNITSTAGVNAFPFFTPYTTSKYASVGFTDALREEVDLWGIKVISLEPEIFKTRLTNKKVIGKEFDETIKNLDTPLKDEHLQRKKSAIDNAGERGGQSPLEMTQSSKNSVKASMLPRDRSVSSSSTFVTTIDALPDRFLSTTDPVSRNRCTERVIVDAFSAVLSGYFCLNAFITRQ
ncbi:estradiol 17-beta-dehydrogenase 2 [Trichonephila clavipes]|nr:estradiol 17-beta-dehydrogenase 2 [Trichonephila clavipes]